jgi:hypothetical protein
VDLLAAFAWKQNGWLEPERAEHRRVEGERPFQIAANEVDVAESDEHGPIRSHRTRWGAGSGNPDRNPVQSRKTMRERTI